MGEPDIGIELVHAITGLRQELLRAADEASGERVRFQVDEISLEFAVELRRDAGARAGFRAWIVSGDTETRSGNSHTQRVSVKLTPVDRIQGRSIEIGNEESANLDKFDRNSQMAP
ncbi:trypco2 family protein [Streptomyces sp. 8N616]|uniref:trypco2 family protein n=1 Tax=Streptomyces sp. 8N616 TaxID=3457414 RepID=UPI003FD3A420